MESEPVKKTLVLAGALLFSAGVTACGPSARDMPVVVVPATTGDARLLFPVCAGDHLKSVTVDSDHQHAKWQVSQPTGGASESSRVVELRFAADGFDAGEQLEGSQLVPDTDGTPISSAFFDLHSVDIWTGRGEAFVQVDWFADSTSTQWLLAEIPYKDGDVSLEFLSESDGRARLLAWCED